MKNFLNVLAYSIFNRQTKNLKKKKILGFFCYKKRVIFLSRLKLKTKLNRWIFFFEEI
jgi:hypothetical protein